LVWLWPLRFQGSKRRALLSERSIAICDRAVTDQAESYLGLRYRRQPSDPLDRVGDIRFKTELLLSGCSSRALCDPTLVIAQRHRSQRGSLIGMLAAKQAKVDALVSIAGVGRPAPALIREQLDTKLPPRLKARSDRILDELVAGRTVTDVPKELAALYRLSVQPYLISWFKYDPVREIAALEIPVRIVQGTTDLQVPVDNAKRLGAAKKDATLRLIDGMNHVLKHATLPAEQQAAYTDPRCRSNPTLWRRSQHS
jgi:hypothetical protein